MTRLAQQLGESPSSIHRLLTALVEHDYVARDEDRRYRLGVGVLKLANAFQHQNRLVMITKPYLTRLSAETRESVFLSELIGHEVICVANAESPGFVAVYMRLGQRAPYHAAASARAVLAYRAEAEQAWLLQAERLDAYTQRTPRTVAEAGAALEETRARGYAICDEELEVGLTAISVPVVGSKGDVAASLSLVAPQDRLSRAARLQTARSLAEVSHAISTELGCQIDDLMMVRDVDGVDPVHERTGPAELSVARSA